MQNNNFDEAQKIIDNTDIVALVSKYVKLQKQGKNYSGLCPFHNEDTPSFIVSPDKKIAHCFGCGGGGNPVKFLQQVENIEFGEAIRRLAEFNGMEYHGSSKKPKVDPNERYYKIMGVAAEYYKKYFEHTSDGLEAKEYLVNRGMTEETIQTFKVGLSPKIGDSLYQVLKDSGFLELDMADASLVDKGVTGYHDIFAERIMFPICDEAGKPVAFSARIFKTKDKNQPKYINSRETPIFQKNQILFNLHLAKSDIMKKKRVILHEGQMDVIASYKSGLKEAICTLGTSLSDAHVKKLSKYTTNAIICYDGDGAGIKASKKAITLFKNYGFNVHLVLLPNGKDPDEFVKEFGSEAYLDYFENNQMDANQYLFEIGILNKDFTDSNVVTEVKNEIFALIQSMTQATEQEDYLKRFSNVLNSSFDAVRQDFDTYRGMHAIPQAQDMYPQPMEYPEDMYFPPEDDTPIVEPKVVKDRWNSICELRLFMYAIANKETAMLIDGRINEYLGAFSINMQQLWIKLIDTYYNEFDKFDQGIFMKLLSEEELQNYLDIYDKLRGNPTKYDDEDMTSCIEKIKVLNMDVNHKALKNRARKSKDITEQSRIIDEIIKNKLKKEKIRRN